MFVDISLDCVEPQRPLCGTLVRVPRPLSLIFHYKRRVMTVQRWSLHGVVSDGHIFGLFVSLPPAVLIRFPRKETFRCKQLLAKLCFSVLCASCFSHGTKAP